MSLVVQVSHSVDGSALSSLLALQIGGSGTSTRLALSRNASFDRQPPSDSSRSTSPVKRRTVKWCRSKFSREPSQGDEASDMVTLDEDFPVSHTRTVTLNEEVECDGSDCELGYHSDTAINIQFSSQLDLRRRAQLSRQASHDGEDDELDSDSDGDRHPNNGATPRHRRGRHRGSENSDVDMHSAHYHDTQDDEGESEYEAPIDRKRKRKDGVVVLAGSRKMKDHLSKKANPLNSSAMASGAPSSAPTPTDSTEPLGLRRPRQGRNGGKRLRTDMGPVADQTASPLTPADSTSVVSAVLEFPCPYVSPEGRPCAKTFPRWTDYEKHYETMHTGDSGYPWVQKIEAKDCPFRCPHPIPSASRPKTSKGRVVKTVEYGPCDFVTRKNTHDFERHWKGNHIRSEALFIARGNMQIEEARYVNVREKYDIAYALCPRCPRCEENFTRTDALTRHLRSPCAGGSVGAAVDETNTLLLEGPNKLGRPPVQASSTSAAASSSSSSTVNPAPLPPLVLPPSTAQPPSNNNNVSYYRQAAAQGLAPPEA